MINLILGGIVATMLGVAAYNIYVLSYDDSYPPPVSTTNHDTTELCVAYQYWRNQTHQTSPGMEKVCSNILQH